MNSYNIAQHEIIIDDSVYDLKAFSKVHPGGTNILNIFGGKDATVHYYMIHPHTSIHKNILEPYKLRHAYITDNRYLLNSIIFQDLKKRVHNAISLCNWRMVY
jgi:cytochrome b involved in lipid metabolism